MNQTLNGQTQQTVSSNPLGNSSKHEKILDSIHQKICSAFQAKFLRKKQFESESNRLSESWVNELKEYAENHSRLLEQKDKSIIRLNKKEYCAQKANELSHFRNSGYLGNSHNTPTPEEIEKFEKEYDEKLISNHSDVVMSLTEFIRHQRNKIETSEDIDNEFWHFFNYKLYSDRFTRPSSQDFQLISHSPKKIIEQFNDHYLAQRYNRLLDSAESYLNDLGLSGFETFVVNVGNRSYNEGRAGWVTHQYDVINDNKRYQYSLNTKDELGIRDEFINIFILQKKYLIKVSISQSQTEQTKFLIWKDCEKLTVKNEVEVHIAKHHGNETIIFDTRKDALNFQSKILEAKEGWKRQ